MWFHTRRVPEGHVEIVEWMGRFRRTAGPGRYRLVPWLERARTRVDLGDQIHLADIPIVTGDNAVVSARVEIRYRVVDPVRATYEVVNASFGLEQLVAMLLRRQLAGWTLPAARDRLTDIAWHARDEAREQSCRWGIEVTNLEIQALREE